MKSKVSILKRTALTAALLVVGASGVTRADRRWSALTGPVPGGKRRPADHSAMSRGGLPVTAPSAPSLVNSQRATFIKE